MRHFTTTPEAKPPPQYQPPPTNKQRPPPPARPRSNSDGELSHPSTSPTSSLITSTHPGAPPSWSSNKHKDHRSTPSPQPNPHPRIVSRSNSSATVRDSEQKPDFQGVVLKSTGNKSTLWQPDNSKQPVFSPPTKTVKAFALSKVPQPSPTNSPRAAPTPKAIPPPPAKAIPPIPKPTSPSTTRANPPPAPARQPSSKALQKSQKSSLQLSLISTETAVEKKEFTVYVLKVLIESSSWLIVRRYKTIRAFAQKLHSQYPLLEPLFPAKKLVGNMEPDFIRKRKEQLQRYVNKIVAIQEVCSSAIFAAFIDEYANPTLETLTNREIDGYLRLQVSSLRKKWKSLYFVIQGEHIFGFRTDQEKWIAAKENILLRNCKIRTVQKDELFTFEIVQPDDTTYLFCADTAAQRHEWMTILVAQTKPPAAPSSPGLSNRPGVRISFSLKGQPNHATLSFDNTVKVEGVKSTLAEIAQLPDKEGERYGLSVANGKAEDDVLWLEDGEHTLNDFDIQNMNVLTFEKVPKKIHRLLKAASSTNIQVALKGKSPNAHQPQITLLPGENIKLAVNDVIHLHSTGGIVGSFTLTTYQLIFSPNSSSVGAAKCDQEGFRIPLGNISHIIRCGGVTCDIGRFYCFEIRTKDINCIRFTYTPSVSTSAPVNITAAIEAIAYPADPRTSFAFCNKELNNIWTKIDLMQYYRRLGIPDKNWRITDINTNYAHATTYPSKIVVPAAISDQELLDVMPFRSKARIPALVWKNAKGVAMVRCSQPVVGVTGKRCMEDEKMFEAIRTANPNSDTLYIIDVRPQLNAVANQVCGMGYEKEYKNCVLKFMGIQNIHHMRESYQRINKAMRNHTNTTLMREAVKGWLFHIKAVLTASSQVEKVLSSGSSVVIHCSDGWDRTPQVISLCKMILDGHYRTIEGFINMVELDWLGFGHKFMERVGFFSSDYKHDQLSPVS